MTHWWGYNQKYLHVFPRMTQFRLFTTIILTALTIDPGFAATTSDRDVLELLYVDCNGNDWFRHNNWLDNNKSICEWQGITCVQNSDGNGESTEVVQSIDLSDNNLLGNPPIALILQMPKLKVLKLGGNSLQWPTNAGDFPVSSGVTYLDLSDTGLKSLSSIFENVQIPDLTDLYLGMNDLFGSFPSEIFQFAFSLERLKLESNNLDGNIPESISNFAHLTYLNLSDNYFEGAIPESVTRLTKLKFLLMKGNKLSGPIPHNIEDLVFLEQLDLSKQTKPGITGELPSFSSLTRLKRLDLSFNSISGRMKSDFLKNVDTNKFDYAFLMSNQISGELPKDPFLRLEQGSIYVQDNKIGRIDPALCDSGRGGAVSAFGCDAILCHPKSYSEAGNQEEEEEKCLDCDTVKYYGATSCPIEIDDTSDSTRITPAPSPRIEPLPSPKLLDVEILEQFYESTGGDEWTNKEGWMTPVSVCTWYGVTCVDDDGESVQFLILSDNNLSGNVPAIIYDLPFLKSLSLSRNQIIMDFSGIEKAKSLTNLDLQGTNLFSVDGLEKANSLVELDVSNNKLEGSIPTNIFSLRSLEELKLDGNSLGGNLSFNFKQLTSLKTLSANDNQLSGDLPDSFSLLTIQTLRLRSNNLSGPIDEILNSMTSLVTIDLSRQTLQGGDGVTGAVPDFASHHQLRRLDLSHNNLSGTIPSAFLSSVVPASFEFANLASNSIGGGIPETLNRLHDIYLQDNMIDTVSDQLCSGTPVLDEFGCDAILCSPGTFNILGRRQSYDTICQFCPEAEYYGAVSCPPRTPYSKPTPPQPPAPPTGAMSERDILELFYWNLGGDGWSESSGWLDAEAHICTWYGIKCDANSKVEIISLGSNGLSGIPPPEIFDLESLTTITLETNAIDFDFTRIENAKNLVTIDLSHTDVESVVGIQKSSSIEHLYLSSTNLRDQIPLELFELQSLVDLSLEFNELNGPIPHNIENLVNLEYLAIHDNRLNGRLPAALGQLKRLKFFMARHNDFSGPLPNELSSLTHAWFIDIADQKSFGGLGITGKLPSFSNFAELRRLDLGSNSLTGDIPVDLLASTNPDIFEYVDLSDNDLRGKIPNFVARLPIDGVYLSNNKFSSIDPGLCDTSRSYLTEKYGCDSILCPPSYYNEFGKQDKDENPCIKCESPDSQYFGSTTCADVGGSTLAPVPSRPNPTPVASTTTEKNILELLYNRCGGPNWEKKDNWMNDNVSICDWFGIRCVESDMGKSVQYILLSSNNLRGTPPQELFLLNNLETLVLDNNEISFDFSGIGKAERLSTLDLSSTKVKSTNGIFAARNLVKLQLTNNDITGPLPDEIFSMEKLEQLSLDFNKFSGGIPDAIGNLIYLRLFSCAFNRLTGTLPSSLGNLKRIVTLRLQSNSLSGVIPEQIGSMADIAFLDLSMQVSGDNRGFTGALPDFATLKDLHRIDLSSNSISGDIPATFLQSSNSEYVNLVDLSSNRLTGNVPLQLARLNNVHLQGNMITSMDESFCNLAFGCNGFLCPPQSYNPLGRQESSSSTCQKCDSAQYYGSTRCDDVTAPSDNSGNSPVSAPSDHVVLTHAPSPLRSIPVTSPKPNEPAPNTELNPTPTPPVGVPPGTGMSEREILELFFTKCKGEHWLYRDNWMTSASICSWNGITCMKGRETVEKIVLGANNVAGVPPVELFQLRNLKSLVLYSNPLDDFKFDWIKEARNLKELVLDATGIENIKGIERSRSLATVKLRFNKIRGNLGDITDLKTLEFLSASNNFLTGTVPSDFDNAKGLKALLLGNNHLEGGLNSVRFPDSLRILDLSSNDLTGTIPSNFLTEFSNSADLSVDLSKNDLTGSVPSTLARFNRLTLLLSDNKISHISEEICAKDDWNGGDVGKFGCKGMLCPKGKSAPQGRQTDTNRCTHCHHARHLGSSVCYDVNYDVNASSGGLRGSVSAIAMLGMIIGTISFLL